MSDLAKNVEFLKAAFKGYDLNSDGRVTVKEFRRIMIRTGETHLHLTSELSAVLLRKNERRRH